MAEVPVNRETLMALIPHQGNMCLLDEVIEWDTRRIHARSWTHQREDNPLRRDDQLSAVHLCEYGAQAMAVHGGLLAREEGGQARPGMLVSLRGVELHVDHIDDLPVALDVRASVLLNSESGWQYEFRIEHAGRKLASGRAAVMLQPVAPPAEENP